MHGDGSVNLDMVPRQAEDLVQSGVSGVFICGTTGEGPSLTTEERMQLAVEWRRAAGSELKVIVHVGHTSLLEAQRLAEHAQRIGADAVATMAPFFFKPAGVGDLVEFCAEVACAAPELPFYFYHIPSMTGVDVPMHDFLAEAAGRIPNLAGIKYTHEDLMDYSRCVGFDGGRFNLLFGRDEMLLAALTVGAEGAVGSTYNFAAPYYHEVIRAYRAGDLQAARSAQARANEVIAAFKQYGGLAAQKAIMRMIGVDCGPVRLPLRPLGCAEYEELKARLAELGFFQVVQPAASK
ncbi:MAG: dihydrodipicolinate synthetase [Firmicutes bacterium]|nr:dihydrodipicolinate synthetase [Bacillota bacterium]